VGIHASGDYGIISTFLFLSYFLSTKSDKQFYLEQAKQLKETFNSRYPDYVYRRRPNNSRKRRRSDSGTMRPVDPSLHHVDDLCGSIELEASPTDTDEHLEVSLRPSYSRPPYAMSNPPIDQTPKYANHSHSRGPGHQVSSELPFRSPRLSYGGSTNSEDLGSTLGSAASPRIPVNQGVHYSYPSNSHTTPAIFGTDSIPPHQTPSHQGWQGRPDRAGPPTWLGGGGGGQDRVHATSLGSQKQNPYSPTATPSTTSSWSNSTTNSPSTNAPSSGGYFPTLTGMPFYHHQQSPQFQSSIAVSTPPHTHTTSSFESLGHIQSGSVSRDFTPRGYSNTSSSITSSSGNSYPVSNRDSLSYPHRTLPPVHPVSTYSHSQHSSQPSSSSSSAGHSNPSHGFWRE